MKMMMLIVALLTFFAVDFFALFEFGESKALHPPSPKKNYVQKITN